MWCRKRLMHEMVTQLLLSLPVVCGKPMENCLNGFVVPYIHWCSHCTCGNWETKSTRTSVSLDETTTIFDWLFTTFNTNWVSASSWLAFRSLNSVVAFDDLPSSYVLNPTATTISLSSGDWEHNSSDKKCTLSALFSASDRTFYLVFWKRNIMTLDKSSDGSCRHCMSCQSGTFDCFFPVSVKDNSRYVRTVLEAGFN